MNKIKATFSQKYNSFSKSHKYQILKKIRPLRVLKVSGAKIIWKFFPAKYRLHNDPILQKAFKKLVEELKVTSIVETGTFMGYSTSFMAENFPNIPIYTGEINPKNYSAATRNLKKFKNVKTFNKNSPDFLENLIKNKLLGEKPLFFLDAHWLNYWPLEDEIKIISEKIKKAIILIDDFKIPGNEAFVYDKYGKKECSLELIAPKMNNKNEYFLLFPNYNRDIFKTGEYNPVLSGYPIIFQNLKKDFLDFSNNDFIKKFFKNETKTLNSLLKK